MARTAFDLLVQTCASAGTRRGLLACLTTLPLTGPLAALFGAHSAAATGLRPGSARRRGADRRDQVQNQRQKKRKRKKKKKRHGCAAAGQTPKRGQSCCAGLVQDGSGPCALPAPTCAQGCPGCCAGESCQAGTSAAACGAGGAPCAVCGGQQATCFNGACRCDVCAPSGGCPYATVQAAVDDAAGPSTIRICAGAYVETIVIDRDVTLIGTGQGTGAGATVLEGTGSDSVVRVRPERTVRLRRLRLRGGGGDAGGGIFNDGTLALTGCTVNENAATLGGGILNFGTAVTLTNSTISGNTATVGGGVHNDGGSTLTLLSGSSITSNTATKDPPSGGGVNNEGTVDAAGGSITGNTPDDCVNVDGGTGCPP